MAVAFGAFGALLGGGARLRNADRATTYRVAGAVVDVASRSHWGLFVGVRRVSRLPGSRQKVVEGSETEVVRAPLSRGSV